MSRNKLGQLLLTVAISLTVFASCNNNEAAQAPAPPPQAVAPAPAPAAPPPAAVPAQPPATPLVPVAEGNNTGVTAPSTGGGGGKVSIDKALPGAKTSGDELLGNYSCAVDAKQLKLGPFKAPPFGCRIFKAGDDLKVASTAEGAGSIKGTVQDPSEGGFFITGKYEVAGNALAIKARMKKKGDTYAGSGRGRFNDDKSTQMNYTLTMTKK